MSKYLIGRYCNLCSKISSTCC